MVLAVLAVTFLTLVGVIIWVISTKLTSLSQWRCFPKCITDPSMELQYPPFSLWSAEVDAMPFQINQFT